MSPAFSSALALTSAALLYSFFAVLTRIMGFDLPLFFASFTRNLLAALLLLLPLWLLGKWQHMSRRDWFWLCLRSAGGILGFVGSYYAFYYLPMGTAYFIFYAGSTIMGFFLGRLFFGEKIEGVELLALVLSIVGLGMIYSLSGIDWQLLNHMLLALAGGVGSAIWNVFSKKVSSKYSAIQLNGADFAIFAVLTVVISLVRQETWVLPAWNVLWLANLLFVLMFVVTGWLVIYGFKNLDSQKGSLLMLLEVVFGVVVGFLVYQETLSVGAVLGGLLILLGAALPNLPGLVNHQKIS